MDKDGFLAGFRGFLPVLNPSGSIAETPVPVGAVGDLNGEGLPDIVSYDPLGYVRIHFNSGSKEQPKFTSGELRLPWLASGEGDPPRDPSMLGGEQEVGEWNQKRAERRQGGTRFAGRPDRKRQTRPRRRKLLHTVGWRGFKQLGEDRVVRGDRGAVQRQHNAIADGDQESSDF